jgi:signal peptidase I
VDGPVLLKRVIGGPGDTVTIRKGRIYLNGMRQPIRYEKDKFQEYLNKKLHPVALTFGGGPDFGPTVIPDDKFLVVGDNRGLSHDGRYFGLVERKSILGRAVGIYFSNSSPTWREL